jgi:predicted ATP-grasp superfamily ATP-dependent carboligase
MRVFLYEYASAQPPDGALPASIRREGKAMLQAVVADFSLLDAVEVVTVPEGGSDEQESFQETARHADWTLVIAPELEGILSTRCRWVEEAGGRLLGCGAAAVEVLADKWQTYQLLRSGQVPVPDTWLASQFPRSLADGRQFVCKPRWGAGSVGVGFLHDSPAAGGHDAFLVQRYHAGLPASCAVLIADRSRRAALPKCPAEDLRQKALRFPAASQKLGGTSGFEYLGGELPLPPDLDQRAGRLVHAALARLAQVPGLRGYLGFDLVLGQDPAGSQDVIVEVNPRLTTSYLGLRRLVQGNLAEAMVLAALGRIPELRWRTMRVAFDSGGWVRYEE